MKREELSSLEMFLHSLAPMNKYLNRKEEMRFFRDYKKNLKFLKDIENQETKEYQEQLSKVKSMQDEVVRLYGAFVINLAKRFYSIKKDEILFDFMDLIQEGLGPGGLLRAAEKFKPSKGYRFISYAIWWVRHSFYNFFYKNCNTIKLPLNVAQAKDKIFQNLENLLDKYGPKLSYKKIDKELKLKPGLAKLVFNSNRVVFSINDEICNYNKSRSRFDEPSYYEDVISDNSTSYPEDSALNRIFAKECLDALEDDEKTIMTFYFGLDRKTGKKTLKEIGKYLNPKKPVSRERVRQLREIAFKKIRRSNIGKELVA